MSALHIDGKPTSWFEYKRNGEVERVTYRAFVICGDDPAELVRHANEIVFKIEDMSRNNGNGEVPVIFWRHRLECIWEDPFTVEDGAGIGYQRLAHNGRWKASFRLAAVPQLTSEQWESLDPKHEGEEVKYLHKQAEQARQA